MCKRFSSIIRLLISFSIGILIGMLFSPNTGEKLRSLIFYQLKKFIRNLYKSLFRWIDKLQGDQFADNSAKVASQEVINKTKEKAHQLLAEVQELSDRLDIKNAH